MTKNVTVLIPTYNHGSFLPYQLDSLLAQTTPPRRIVVLDDGSTDDTQVVLERYRGENTIRVISHQKNLGIIEAHSRLLYEVDTEFFAFASADDLLIREWCEIMASLLETYPKAKIAFSNTFVVEEDAVFATDNINVLNGTNAGVYDPQEFAEAVFRIGKLPPSNTIMYRSDIIEDLILPVWSDKRLGSAVDIISILEIATRHPSAYSANPTGVFIRSPYSYGSLATDLHHQRYISKHIEQLSYSDKLLEPDRFAKFANRLVEYTWLRQAITRSQAENRRSRTGPEFLWVAIVLYVRALVIFIKFRRIRYARFKYLSRRYPVHALTSIIDERLLGRFCE